MLILTSFRHHNGQSNRLVYPQCHTLSRCRRHRTTILKPRRNGAQQTVQNIPNLDNHRRHWLHRRSHTRIRRLLLANIKRPIRVFFFLMHHQLNDNFKHDTNRKRF
jgi:hypothetical protein